MVWKRYKWYLTTLEMTSHNEAEAVIWRYSGKNCSMVFHKIHKKTPVPESLLNNIAGCRSTALSNREDSTCFDVHSFTQKFLKQLVIELFIELLTEVISNVQRRTSNLRNDFTSDNYEYKFLSSIFDILLTKWCTLITVKLFEKVCFRENNYLLIWRVHDK